MKTNWLIYMFIQGWLILESTNFIGKRLIKVGFFILLCMVCIWTISYFIKSCRGWQPLGCDGQRHWLVSSTLVEDLGNRVHRSRPCWLCKWGKECVQVRILDWWCTCCLRSAFGCPVKTLILRNGNF